jgi:hypothetical protein
MGSNPSSGSGALVVGVNTKSAGLFIHIAPYPILDVADQVINQQDR